jgi:hypothetical protein
MQFPVRHADLHDLQHTHTPRGYQAAMPTTMVSIRITDSGLGMNQEFIDNHIFKPFAKADVHAVRTRMKRYEQHALTLSPNL